MEIKELIGKQELDERIKNLAMQIEKDYDKKEIVVIGILTGAVYFTTALTNKIKNNIELYFMKVSSYGVETDSSGKVTIEIDLKADIKGKDVLIVEDIVDTGYTLKYIKEYLSKKEPKSIKCAVLLDKKERRKVKIDADYTGFEIPNKFVMGYGLDYKEKYRNLPYVGYIEI